MKKRNRVFALLTALSLLLGLLAGCGTATAAVMKLRKTKGTVRVTDDGGKSLEAERDLGLYSGYEVRTRNESYAWIDLDEVKLTKLDEDSAVEITQNGGKLELELRSGGLFFNVTEPLEEDETLEIRTSSMVVGIRGTCGWVTVSGSGDAMQVWLLEGKVRCQAGSESQTVRAGEMAVLTGAGEITVTPFPQETIPTFVWEELEGDEDLRAEIERVSGLELSSYMPGVVVMTTPTAANGSDIAEILARPDVTGVILRRAEDSAQNYIILRDLDAPDKLLRVEDINLTIQDSTLGRVEHWVSEGYEDGLASALRDCTVGSLSVTNRVMYLYGCTTGDIQVRGGSLSLNWYNISDRSCVTGDIRFDGSLLDIQTNSRTGDIVMLSGELRVDNSCTTGTVTYPNGGGPEAEGGAASAAPAEGRREAFLALLDESRSRNQTLGDTDLDRADNYLLYDIDKDSTPELIAGLSRAYPSASRLWVYTFRDGAAVNVPWDGQEAQNITTSGSGFHPAPGENGIYYYNSGGPHGSTLCQLWRVEDGQLTIQSVPAGEVPDQNEMLAWSSIASDSLVRQYE